MKTNHKYKAICLFLALLLLFCFGCTEEKGVVDESLSTPSQPPQAESQQPEGWIDGLENVGDKYNDRVFKIVTTSRALFSADDMNVLLGKAVQKRNDLVSNKYGVSFEVEERSASQIMTELKAAASKGERYADLICAPADVLAQLASGGMLENLYSLPCIDFDGGYMPKDELAEQSVNSTMYMFTGSLTMATNECLVLFYNKKLVAQQGIDPIELVNDNAWTWSTLKMLVGEIAKSAKDGIASTLNDTQLAMAVYNSSGKRLVIGSSPAYDRDVAEVTRRIMSDIFNNEELCPSYDDTALQKEFEAGNLGFVIGQMSDVTLLGSKCEWGVLPLPKHSEEQAEYYTPLPSDAAAVAVPCNSGDSAFVGTVLNALFAASSDTLEEAQRLTYINYYFWSNDSSVMLYRLTKSKLYDIGNIYSDLPAVAEIGKILLTSPEVLTLSDEAREAFRNFAEKIFF